MAGRVLLKIAYLLVRRVLGLAVLVSHSDLAKDAELLVLRHENAVLRRHAGRVRYEPADRAWFAALASLLPRRRWSRDLPRDASDAAGLAPQPGCEKVRHEQAAQARPPADSPGRRPPRRSPGQGECAMGTPRRIHGELAKLRKALADRARNGNVRFRRPPLRPSEFVPPTWLRVAILSGHGEDHSAYLPDHAALPGELASSFSGRSSAGSPGEASCLRGLRWPARSRPSGRVHRRRGLADPGPPSLRSRYGESARSTGRGRGRGRPRRRRSVAASSGDDPKGRCQHRPGRPPFDPGARHNGVTGMTPNSPPLSGRPFIEARTRASAEAHAQSPPLSGRPFIEAGYREIRRPMAAGRRP